MISRDTCLARYARLDALDPDQGSWLRGEEASEFNRIHDMPRRRQWLAGRALSRALLAEAFSLDVDGDLQILSRDDRNLGVSPRVLVNGREFNCGLSIAHSDRGALVAVSPARSMSIGVDLCGGLIATPGFLRLWFTPAEQGWILGDSKRAATAWSMKEAVFKAMVNSAAWNPRQVEVLPARRDGYQCAYQGQQVTPLTLVVRELDGHVAAITLLANDVKVCIESVDGDGVVAIFNSLECNPVCGSCHD